MSCPLNCLRCDPADSSICTRCDFGYGVNLTTNVCVPCVVENCKTCSADA